MSGVAVIRTLLAASAAVTAVVPATRIICGKVPLNTALPAILITQVSSVPQNLIRSNETGKAHIERVQVTVFRKDSPSDAGYPGLKPLLDLVLAACQNQRATIASTAVDSIIPDTEGPDLDYEEISAFARSRDFIVTYID